MSKLEYNLLFKINNDNFFDLFAISEDTMVDLQSEINDSQMNEGDDFDNNLLLSLWILRNKTPFTEVAKILRVEENQIKLICESYFKRIIELSSKYITWPSASEMMCLESFYEMVYDLPRIIGALGCLRIAVQLPENMTDCSEYNNVNSTTVILQVVCDSNLLFRDVFVGFPGNNNIVNTLKASPLYKRLSNEEELLVKTERYVIAERTEYPQEVNVIMPRPCGERGLSEEQLQFNSEHSSAMCLLDTTFHMIENRFQRLQCLDNLNVELATLAVRAICTLHNFASVRRD